MNKSTLLVLLASVTVASYFVMVRGKGDALTKYKELQTTQKQLKKQLASLQAKTSKGDSSPAITSKIEDTLYRLQRGEKDLETAKRKLPRH